MHLCGINQPQVILALIPGGSPEEILFLPEKNPSREFWDGIRFGVPTGNRHSGDLNDVRVLTGIKDIRRRGEFDDWYKTWVRHSRKNFVNAFYHAYRKGREIKITKTDHNYEFKSHLEKMAQDIRPKFEIHSCAPLHFQLRLPLEPDQTRDIDRATSITREAFQETLSRWKIFKNENEVAASLEYGMRRRSPYGLSFPTIVAGGQNATVLHYLKNDEILRPGSLVLMDFGARFGTMHADISRTVPSTGKFNPLQRLLYGIVLDAQKFGEKFARPGRTIRELDAAVWDFTEAALKKRFFALGGKAERAYDHKPHGVSHLMGEQEHDGDPHKFYQDEPLRTGWQISNEPGLYGRFTLKWRGRRYDEMLGIRIEDNLLITKTGCLNLSLSIPREIKTIESRMHTA